MPGVLKISEVPMDIGVKAKIKQARMPWF